MSVGRSDVIERLAPLVEAGRIDSYIVDDIRKDGLLWYVQVGGRLLTYTTREVLAFVDGATLTGP